MKRFAATGLASAAENVLLELGAEAAKLAQSASLGGAANVLDRTNAELLNEQLDTLRAKAGNGGDFAEISGKLAFERLQQVEFACLDNRRDFARQIFADPRQFGEVFARAQHRRHALGKTLENARGAPIGSRAKRIIALDLKELRRLVEHCGDFGIVDRHPNASE